MVEAPKHTLRFAASISGLHSSQFSRLLKDHVEEAKDSLVLLSQIIAQEAAKDRQILVPSTQWSVLLIIDSTLHKRSSLHCQNSQRFNHGDGFVVGHQWTNIVLVVDGQVIPLPPISFFSKNECKRRGILYKTEHEHIIAYLGKLHLGHWLGAHSAKEVVVLMDSGYDNKKILQVIKGRGWDFVCALKTNRCAKTFAASERNERKWYQIHALFKAVKKQAPWMNIRVTADKGKKRKEFRARRLEGYLKGLKSKVALVCSEKYKSKTKGRKYLVCSNLDVSVGAIVRAYRERWAIELFHRAVKNNLGLQHVGVEGFDSMISHVHWVYCSYLLINNVDVDSDGKVGLEHRQRKLKGWLDSGPYRKIIQLSTRAGGKDSIKKSCQEVIAAIAS
jgi:hypothetical protein